MFNRKRWLCLILTLALSTSLILPIHAADPLAGNFATFLIHAEDTDSPQLNLQVELYRRDNAGAFRVDNTIRYSCSVNRIAGQASFFIQPQADGVWVEVDYLTDLDGDGVYEMLDGENSPVSDAMTSDSRLSPRSSSVYTLTRGQTYILTSQTLAARGSAVLKARNTAGNAQILPSAGGLLPSADTILYLVTLHYPSSADQEEYTLCYYLRLFDSVIMPSDVSAGAWYYDAVEYALEKGLFSGTGVDSFSPNLPMTRAMLWAVLARLDGQSLPSSSPWYSASQAWAKEAGVSDGQHPDGSVTREQLALMLYNLADPDDSTRGKNMMGFSDTLQISSWAIRAVDWAIGEGILSGKGNGILDPKGCATRAEVAAMLRRYSEILQA